MSRALPAPKSIGELLSGLLGKEVTVTEGEPLALGSENPSTVVVYIKSDKKIGAVCICGLNLASNAGAALSLIPAEVAAENASSGRLSTEIYENFREILNIVSGLFNGTGAPHVVLSQVGMIPNPIPENLAGLFSNALARLNLDVEISGYGPGKMSLLAL